MNVGILRDPLFLRHDHGPAHPERPERLQAVDRAIDDFPFPEVLEEIVGRDATLDEIESIHDAEYVERIAQTANRERTYIDPDTSPNGYSYAAAVRGAGAAISAVDYVMSTSSEPVPARAAHAPAPNPATPRIGSAASAISIVPCRSAFAFVRPPGHHAERDRAMGFCLFNNAAIAAVYALRAHHLSRVLILDWDVHHGNGTMKSFYDSDSVLYVSLHQYPHYPGTGTVDEIGKGRGRGFTLNLPLRTGMEDQEYLALFRDLIVPVSEEFGPEIVVVSCGFDAHERDPLADMQLTDDAYSRMTQAMMEVASHHSDGRLVFVLEGGYNLDAIASGTTAVLAQLGGHGDQDWRRGLLSTGGYIGRIEKDVRANLSAYWRCLR